MALTARTSRCSTDPTAAAPTISTSATPPVASNLGDGTTIVDADHRVAGGRRRHAGRRTLANLVGVFAAKQAQTISGGGGNDNLDGGIGIDSIDGGDGDDLITGGAEEATISMVETASIPRPSPARARPTPSSRRAIPSR